MAEGVWRGAGGFVVDARDCPLVVVTYPAAVDLDSYVSLFQEYARLAALHRQIAWLIDFRTFNPVTAPASVRQATGKVFAEYRDRLLPSTLCEARVVESSLSRGVLTAFDWITGSKWPTSNFATFEQAEAWIRGLQRKSA